MFSAFSEYDPAGAVWMAVTRLRKLRGAMPLAAVSFGVPHSTLHQSGLGALFMMAKDTIFPLDGVQRLHAKMRGIYRLYGAGDHLGDVTLAHPGIARASLASACRRTEGSGRGLHAVDFEPDARDRRRARQQGRGDRNPRCINADEVIGARIVGIARAWPDSGAMQSGVVVLVKAAAVAGWFVLIFLLERWRPAAPTRPSCSGTPSA